MSAGLGDTAPRLPGDSVKHFLEVEDLRVSFTTDDGVVRALDGVSFAVEKGEVVAIVGESGSGKSVAGMTLMGLTRGPNTEINGAVRLDGRDLLTVSDVDLRQVRGEEIAIVFQDPLSSLNPVHRIGDQIVEQIRAHRPEIEKTEAMTQAIGLMERAGIPQAAERARSYPHQLSGGIRQRAMIAMALSCSPKLLIADEPTTALDVTTQAQILDELRRLREETNAGIILITHDLAVVADIADRVIVMYGGRIVEEGTLDEIFHDPQHPYTWGLLGSITRIDRRRDTALPTIPGTPPSLLSPPLGCHFRPRCPHAFVNCIQVPRLESHLAESTGHLDRCWLTVEQKRQLRLVEGQFGLLAPDRVGQ